MPSEICIDCGGPADTQPCHLCLSEVGMNPAPAQPRQALLDLVVDALEHDRIKHDLDANHTINHVNSWSHYELLQVISDAIETIRSE